jgi:hypothetical protein
MDVVNLILDIFSTQMSIYECYEYIGDVGIFNTVFSVFYWKWHYFLNDVNLRKLFF